MGGMALGLEEAGFEHQILIEFNSKACNTLMRNRPNWPVEETDIRAVSFKNLLGQIDLLAGGPPCQPFSLGGKHGGLNDPRNMFPEAVRAVREIAPGAFLFENVRGLTRPSFLPYFEYILAQLELPNLNIRIGENWLDHKRRLLNEKRFYTQDLFYRVHWMKVNAANYGTPQIRHRVVIWGIRGDLRVNIPDQLAFPTHSQAALSYSQDISGDYWREHDLPIIAERTTPVAISLHARENRWRTLRDALAGLPEPMNGKESGFFRNHIGIPGARLYSGHTGSILDAPAKAVKAGDHGCPGGEHILVRDDESFRYLTVRECARIQEIPDDWTFECSRTEAMRQIGNAVPVGVARLLGNNLHSILCDSRANEVGAWGR